MATSTASTSASVRPAINTDSASFRMLLPYLIAMATQLPMLVLYFRNLWGRPHYGFFPLAILSVVVLAYWRWPKGSATPFRRSLFSSVALFGSLLFGVGSVLFVEPWFSAVCIFLLLASLFARTNDRESDGSLLPVSLLFLICVLPPFRLDNSLITWLQQISARITSQLLDLVGYAHFMPGTVILAPRTEGFGIEEACSGVQSFFTLMFVALLFVVYFRRPWFRASLLLLSVVFWAIFMNTLRIFVIPMADRIAEIDLSHGIQHDLLGYVALILGMLMLYSTDQFLLFLFGPTEDFGDDSGGWLRSVTRFWNRVVSGQGGEPRKKRSSSLGKSALVPVWSVAGVLILGGAFNLTDVYRSISQPDLNVRFFDANVLVPLERTSVPETVDNWRLVDYRFEDRSRGSDLGQYSDIWVYRSPSGISMVSMDQAFPGWHELTTCYRNQGWELVKRNRMSGENEDGEGWPYVVAEFKNALGQQGFLVFSLFDAYGEPFDPPGDWSFVNYFVNGLANRMNNRVRSRLYRGESYQTQAFVTSYNDIGEDVRNEVTERYLVLREALRDDFLKKRSGESVPPKAEGPPAVDP